MKGGVTRSGQQVRQGRISPALRTAIRLIVTGGLSQADAAKTVGYKEHSLSIALKKPHVKALMAETKRAWLDSEGEMAWVTVTKLMRDSKSDAIKLQSAQLVLAKLGELETEADKDAKTTPQTLIQIVQQASNPDSLPTRQTGGIVEVVAQQGLERRPLDRIASLTPINADDLDA